MKKHGIPNRELPAKAVVDAHYRQEAWKKSQVARAKAKASFEANLIKTNKTKGSGTRSTTKFHRPSSVGSAAGAGLGGRGGARKLKL